MGYHRAGFDVVGVDIKHQPHYPFEFHRADALEYLVEHGRGFDAIHASPPCQAYSVCRSLTSKEYPRLVLAVRGCLDRIGVPYVIENVEGAPLYNPLMLCGTMFGLRVLRHRIFETKPAIYFAPASCRHNGLATGNHLRRSGKTCTPGFVHGYEYITVAGNNFLADDAREAMGIEWMSKREIAQAIPPSYTEFIGQQLLACR